MAVVQKTISSGMAAPSWQSTTSSPKRTARIAGLLYLIVGVFGGFAVGYVSPLLYVAGDAAGPPGDVVANADPRASACSPTSCRRRSSSSWR